MEGTEPNRVTAPSRALRTCFTLTSLVGVEHMPTPCNYVHTESRPCQGSEFDFCTQVEPWRWCDAVACSRTGFLPLPNQRRLQGPSFATARGCRPRLRRRRSDGCAH